MLNITTMSKGLQLFLTATARPNKWYRNLICNVFHSQYDDKIFEALQKSRKSTQALCADFPNCKLKLDNGIQNTINIISTQQSDYKFFLDLMWSAFEQEDHQTAHMLYIVLTDQTLKHIPRPKRATEWFEKIHSFYGGPIYTKHIHYWRSVRSDTVLPSIIAFDTFIARRMFMKRYTEVQEARQFMEIFQFLEYDSIDVLPIYQESYQESTKPILIRNKEV